MIFAAIERLALTELVYGKAEAQFSREALIEAEVAILISLVTKM